MPIHRTPAHSVVRGRKAQSFVEFAIFLPIFLILLTGLTEFGFLLNQYLNIMDGPREGARFAADLSDQNNLDPKVTDPGTCADPTHPATFFTVTAGKAANSTQPIPINTATDDIVITVYSVDSSSGTSVITASYPTSGPFSCYGHYTSKFSQTDVLDMINTPGSSIPPNTGVVLVEIFYNYPQLLKLPWITVFVPDPVLLHSYTMMPCPAATP